MLSARFAVEMSSCCTMADTIAWAPTAAALWQPATRFWGVIGTKATSSSLSRRCWRGKAVVQTKF